MRKFLNLIGLNENLKRFAAILFLSLLLFNWFGYKLVLTYLQQKADLRLEARIDVNDYEESHLIEIRMPLQLPYQTSWEEFERCYGQIEVQGRSYTYVKRKMVDGYVILKCIPNRTREVIESTEHQWVQATQGAGHETDKASSFVKAVKCYIGDFDRDKETTTLNGLITLNHRRWPAKAAFVAIGFVTSDERPPNSPSPPEAESAHARFPIQHLAF